MCDNLNHKNPNNYEADMKTDHSLIGIAKIMTLNDPTLQQNDT